MFQVGCQLWTAYAPCGSQHKDAVQITLEQVFQGYEDRNDQSILSYSHMIWGYEGSMMWPFEQIKLLCISSGYEGTLVGLRRNCSFFIIFNHHGWIWWYGAYKHIRAYTQIYKDVCGQEIVPDWPDQEVGGPVLLTPTTGTDCPG